MRQHIYQQQQKAAAKAKTLASESAMEEAPQAAMEEAPQASTKAPQASTKAPQASTKAVEKKIDGRTKEGKAEKESAAAAKAKDASGKEEKLSGERPISPNLPTIKFSSPQAAAMAKYTSSGNGCVRIGPPCPPLDVSANVSSPTRCSRAMCSWSEMAASNGSGKQPLPGPTPFDSAASSPSLLSLGAAVVGAAVRASRGAPPSGPPQYRSKVQCGGPASASPPSRHRQ